jgi:glycosyltransferase involved in cell wall biosynthesis
MTTLSIALATYNGSQFIAEQLNSYLLQTRMPDELVVSDDCSSDQTLSIVEQFAGSAPFTVRILENDRRLGFAENFFRAMGACSCEVIALSDQDDVWMPRKLELGLRRIEADGSLLALHPSIVTDASLRKLGYNRQGIGDDRFFEPLQLDLGMSGWGHTLMFRRELLEAVDHSFRPQHPGRNHPMAHDTWSYVIGASLGRVSHISEPLCFYRQHGKNAASPEPVANLAGRTRSLLTAPVDRHVERLAFYRFMTKRFAEASERGGLLHEAAAAAAARFAERASRLDARIRVYTNQNPGNRALALLEMHRLPNSDRSAGRWASIVKDLALGVLRVGWVIPPVQHPDSR